MRKIDLTAKNAKLKHIIFSSLRPDYSGFASSRILGIATSAVNGFYFFQYPVTEARKGQKDIRKIAPDATES